MKRLSLIIFILTVVFSFPLYSAQKGSARILVYTFNNEQGPVANAHYATILAESLVLSLQGAGQYVVEKSDSVKPAYRTASVQRTILEREMAYTSQSGNYDVIISGSYRVSGNSISTVTNVFIADTGSISPVGANGALGVSLSNLINTLSERELAVIRDYYSGTIFGPQFTPAQRYYKHFTTVTISAEPGAEIYYTLDGTQPTKERGKRYLHPFDIFRSHTFNAVSYKNGGYSQSSRMDYTQIYRASPFELKCLYGFAQFLSPKSMGALTQSPVLTVTAGWEVATNEGARKVPFIRDLGLLARGDFAGSDCDGTSYASMQSYSAGFFYRIRLGSQVMIDIPLTGGVCVQSYIADKDKSFSSMLYKSGSAQDTAYDPVFSTGLLLNWEINHFGLVLGPQFSYVMNSDEKIMYVAWQGGFFIRI